MPAYKGFDQCVSILLAYAHEGDGFPEELTGCLDEVTVNIILCMLPLSKAFPVHCTPLQARMSKDIIAFCQKLPCFNKSNAWVLIENVSCKAVFAGSDCSSSSCC